MKQQLLRWFVMRQLQFNIWKNSVQHSTQVVTVYERSHAKVGIHVRALCMPEAISLVQKFNAHST